MAAAESEIRPEREISPQDGPVTVRKILLTLKDALDVEQESAKLVSTPLVRTLKRRGRGFVVGPPGSGKTSVAQALTEIAVSGQIPMESVRHGPFLKQGESMLGKPNREWDVTDWVIGYEPAVSQAINMKDKKRGQVFEVPLIGWGTRGKLAVLNLMRREEEERQAAINKKKVPETSNDFFLFLVPTIGVRQRALEIRQGLYQHSTDVFDYLRELDYEVVGIPREIPAEEMELILKYFGAFATQQEIDEVDTEAWSFFRDPDIAKWATSQEREDLNWPPQTEKDLINFYIRYWMMTAELLEIPEDRYKIAVNHFQGRHVRISYGTLMHSIRSLANYEQRRR